MTRESALQREIKQGRPFRSSRQEAALGLLKTAEHVRNLLTRRLERHGITFQQYNVLRILRGAGAEGIPTLEIAERMIEEAPGITRLLDRLETKGHVRRQRCPEDRRQVLCYATPAALELLHSLDRKMEDADHEALGALSEPDAVRLIQLLDAIRAGRPPMPGAEKTDRRAKRPEQEKKR